MRLLAVRQIGKLHSAPARRSRMIEPVGACCDRRSDVLVVVTREFTRRGDKTRAVIAAGTVLTARPRVYDLPNITIIRRCRTALVVPKARGGAAHERHGWCRSRMGIALARRSS